MNIQEAAKRALEIDGFMVQPGWPHIGIRPTNTPNCCVLYGVGPQETKSPGSRWNPQAGDLVSDEWEVVRTIDELPLSGRPKPTATEPAIKFDKDLGFADRYVLLEMPRLKVIKLVYKGTYVKMGEQIIVRTYDAEGFVTNELCKYGSNKDWHRAIE